MYHLENYTKLADSMLWELQRKFFTSQGVEAWNHKVPFYITSNPYIADNYADIIMGLILDLVADKQLAAEPLYILELGSGSGKFAYLLLRALEDKLATANLTGLKYCYIMSDFAEVSFKYWHSNEYLQKMIDLGKLDFALVDLEHTDTVRLHYARKPLILSQNPLITIANYVFDSIRHDGFILEDKCYYDLQVRPYMYQKIPMHKLLTVMRDHINLEFNKGQLRNIQFEDPIIEQILQDYAQEFNNLVLLIPSAGLKMIRNLCHLAHGKLLLIVSDKADIHLQDGDLSYPHIAFHGSFSLKVNYDLFSRYFRYLGGQNYQQYAAHGLRTAVFKAGNLGLKFLHCQYALDRVLKYCSPSDYFITYQSTKKMIEQASLEQILAILKLSRFDPTFFSFAESRIIALIQDGQTQHAGALFECMNLVVNNFYYMTSAPDVFFAAATVSFYLKNFEMAIHMYTRSQQHFGDNYTTSYNLVLCYLELGAYHLASEKVNHAFKYVKKADANYTELVALSTRVKLAAIPPPDEQLGLAVNSAG